MSILIKGMKMPKDCEACPFWEGLVNGCPITHYFTIRRKGVDRPEWCPLFPVPDHGDLIDRDVVADALDVMAVYGRLRDAFDMVMSCEAVIPAERSEDDNA